MATSLVLAFSMHLLKTLSDEARDYWYVGIILTDTVITLSLFFVVGRMPVRKPKKWKRVLAWCLAPLASVAAYLVSYWYVEALRRYIALDWLYPDSNMQWSLFVILTAAVQPAIIEELFFRYFAYGALRQLTHAHSAIALSALMFAMAHLYNPMGLPFLFMMGIMFGYARAYSGGLFLPILMHFGHNLAIIYMENIR